MTRAPLPNGQVPPTETPREPPPETEQPYATLWIADREILLYESESDRPFFLSN